MQLLLAVLLATSVIGCNTESAGPQPPQNTIASPVANWEAFNSTDQTFAVEFPSVAELWETEFESPDYGHTDVYHVSAEFNGTLYGVNYNDYPRELTDSEVRAELKIAYSLPENGAEILETSEVEMAHASAVEVVSKIGPIYMISRYFITDSRRLYSLQSGSTRDLRTDRSEIDRFFDSFQLFNGAESGSSGSAE
jgi:hypothetical protein